MEQIAPAASALEVAQTLQELGISAGDKVGVIGYAYDSFWARLARVMVAAEMLEADTPDFWRGDEKSRQDVLKAIASAGLNAVVAEYVPQYVRLSGWHRVGDTSYYIYVFRK